MLYTNEINSAASQISGRPLVELLHRYRALYKVETMREQFLKHNTQADRDKWFDNIIGKYVVEPYQGVAKVTDSSKVFDWLTVRSVLTTSTWSMRAGDMDVYVFATKSTALKFVAEWRKMVFAQVWDRIENRRLEARGMQITHAIHNKPLKVSQGHDIGEALAVARKAFKDDSVAELDLHNLMEMLNNARLNTDTKSAIISKFNEVTDIFNDAFVCPDCGEVEHYDNSNTTLDGDVICNSCVDNYYYSVHHDAYIHTDEARPYYDTARAYNTDSPTDWFSINRDYDCARYEEGAYFEEDTYYQLFEEDEEDEDDDGLSSYHGAYRNFVEQASDKRYVPLGVELEVYAEDRFDVVRSMRNDSAFKDTYLERDGSLDDECGFEIITQPLGKTEWDSFAPKLLTHLLDRKVLGYNHPDSNSYGIHISINRAYLSPLQEARMSMFLTAEENMGFVKAIAQRNAIYGGSDTTQIGSLDVEHQQVRYIGGLGRYQNGKKKIYGMGKYSPLNLKSDVAECRIFQSTLHPQSFMKNLEFIWALVEWTNVKTATGSSWMHTDFIKWLSARPNADKDFGNLFAYLRRPKYIVKRGSGSISNTWLGLLPHITTKSQPVEDIEEEALAA